MPGGHRFSKETRIWARRAAFLGVSNLPLSLLTWYLIPNRGTQVHNSYLAAEGLPAGLCLHTRHCAPTSATKLPGPVATSGVALKGYGRMEAKRKGLIFWLWGRREGAILLHQVGFPCCLGWKLQCGRWKAACGAFDASCLLVAGTNASHVGSIKPHYAK